MLRTHTTHSASRPLVQYRELWASRIPKKRMRTVQVEEISSKASLSTSFVLAPSSDCILYQKFSQNLLWMQLTMRSYQGISERNKRWDDFRHEVRKTIRRMQGDLMPSFRNSHQSAIRIECFRLENQSMLCLSFYGPHIALPNLPLGILEMVYLALLQSNCTELPYQRLMEPTNSLSRSSSTDYRNYLDLSLLKYFQRA